MLQYTNKLSISNVEFESIILRQIMYDCSNRKYNISFIKILVLEKMVFQLLSLANIAQL